MKTNSVLTGPQIQEPEIKAQADILAQDHSNGKRTRTKSNDEVQVKEILQKLTNQDEESLASQSISNNSK